MQKQLKQYAARYAQYGARLLSSERFYYFILLFFIVQAVWIAISAQYPMAFDENFHFGLIKLHADQWLPYFTSQPAHAEAYGAAVRDPSYLYHFLMSIPYRGLTVVTDSETAQIIGLRLINVMFVVATLILFRRLLAKLGASRALNHLCLFLFTMVPIVPFLGAHINYDNLFNLLTVGILLLTIRWTEVLRKQRQFPLLLTILIATLVMTTCLVKYAFLPIGVAVVGFMLYGLWRNYKVLSHLKKDWLHEIKSASRFMVVGTLVLCVAISFLFVERYAQNFLQYHGPNPDCGKVLSVDECLSYGPWGRDHRLAENKSDVVHTNFGYYVVQWVYGMWTRSFFAINYNYRTASPLPVPAYTALALAAVTVVLTIIYGYRIFARKPYLVFCGLIIVAYVGALFMQTYKSYLATNVPVAINGRYLIPLLPVIFLISGYGFRELFAKRQSLKTGAATVVCVLFLLGGGFMTFIVRSDSTWYWHSAFIDQINHTARTVLTPVIPHYIVDRDQSL